MSTHLHPLDQDINLAEQLADISGEIIRRYFRQPHLRAETKLGQVSSIVTIADQQAEEAMVKMILTHAPDDGIIREEGENIPSRSGRYWVLDPIDGTSSFVKGLPIFGTLIGLVDLEQNLPLLGVVNQPILQQRWLGIRGKPTYYNHQPVVNPYANDDQSKLEDACLTSTTPLMFITDRQQQIAKKLQQICVRTAFGGDCYNYVALASGWCAMPMIILEADLNFYDFCAIIPIIQGAGGIITDWSGNTLVPQSTEVIACSTSSLWEQALQEIESI
ncbi:inositol monophosphatase [Gloeothece citriformis PCC 7424]|uniref:Inositol monophosphatase n=1 Tax=Gloeothece citriformis (strain PCC 7424) TaxID=65393 RepID=B7KD76_GLOC7|nr:inositol monophosphatase family protein [Gloeothece citriformis]ACK68896.1 inositol monophosphatase [Gloeothece citriformis PCC 7424]